MPFVVANNAFDMRALITTGSLSEFFEFGTVISGTDTELVVEYAEDGVIETLVLQGTFTDYVDGYPTSGTVNFVSYALNGDVLFSVEDMSIGVQAFTDYVMADNLEGLFQEVLGGADQIDGSAGDDVLYGYGGDDSIRGGLGSDELIGGDGHDLLVEFSGIDGPFGNDIYDGGAGIDRVSYYAEYGYGVAIDLRTTSAQNTGVYGTDTLVSIEHITATYGDDTLIGNDVGNWFWTFNGFDQLTGNGGDDLFTVGLGDKIVDGGAGSDTVEILDLAYEPAYTAEGVAVSLQLQGQAQATGVGLWTLNGIENLGGSYGSDELTGDGNANVLAGYEGDDTLVGAAGDDILSGDGGYNVGYVSAAWELVADHNTEGWAFGNDHLDGGAGNDELYGSAGDDLLNGGADDDLLDGGVGIDTASYAGAAAGVTVDLGLAGAQNTGGAGIDTLVSIEALTGSSFDDVLTGAAAGETLMGAAGDDYVFGNAGNDVLGGGAGVDRLFGGVGNDIYMVEDATDYAFENAGEGTDEVVATVSHVLRENVENLTLSGAAAIDGIGNTLDNVINGNAAANALYGVEGNDYLYGNAGDDTLDGGEGLNRLFGGVGDDTYVIRDGNDYAFEAAGEGTDTVYSDVSHYLRANVEVLRMTGTASITGVGNAEGNTMVGNSGTNRLYGEGGNDWLYGEGGRDRLDGGAGIDRMFGGDGDDVYIVGDSTDYAIEYAGQGNDTVYASVTFGLGANVEHLRMTGTASINGLGNESDNAMVGNAGANSIAGRGGNDRLWGQDGNDRLYGDGGNDVLRGGNGDDFFEGGTGRDHHYGNAGADLFVFRDGDFASAVVGGNDRILDFSQAEGDQIHLGTVDADTALDGDQAFSFVGTNAFTGAAGELRYEQIEGDTYVSGDTNGDGVADFMILVDGLHSFSGGDFIL